MRIDQIVTILSTFYSSSFRPVGNFRPNFMIWLVRLWLVYCGILLTVSIFRSLQSFKTYIKDISRFPYKTQNTSKNQSWPEQQTFFNSTKLILIIVALSGQYYLSQSMFIIICCCIIMSIKMFDLCLYMCVHMGYIWPNVIWYLKPQILLTIILMASTILRKFYQQSVSVIFIWFHSLYLLNN